MAVLLPAANTLSGCHGQAFLQPNNGVRTFPAGGHGAVFLRSHMTMYIFRHNSAAPPAPGCCDPEVSGWLVVDSVPAGALLAGFSNCRARVPLNQG